MAELIDAETAKERRKRQNRLNQQARRKRLADQVTAQGPTQKWVIYSAPTTEHGQPSTSTASSSQAIERLVPFCQQPNLEQADRLKRVQAVAIHNFLQHTLDEQLLTPVTGHNIYRAMYMNATYLGLTMDMLRGDIVSPFNMFTASAFGTAELPPTLQPTTLQSQIVHHPWIDLCPIPSVRDAMLSGMDTYDEDELCHDLFVGGSGDGEHQVGLVLWGEPWDPSVYEFSETVLRKWQWLLGGCIDAIRTTNHWRSTRNKKPIRLRIEPSHDGS